MKYFADDDVLTKFYDALADGDEKSLRRVHIPRSDVFYVREAIFQKTGVRYSLDRVERAMYLEGHLKKRDVLDPDRKREFG
jgi:hypothetical protein